MASLSHAQPNRDHGATEESTLLDRGHEHVRRFWQGFTDFALQGNLLEFAFGLMCVIM